MRVCAVTTPGVPGQECQQQPSCDIAMLNVACAAAPAVTTAAVQALSLMSDDPRQYALALAEGMTGQPLQLQGYGPAYDALLQVAPAAALTPEAIAAGHQLVGGVGWGFVRMLVLAAAVSPSPDHSR